jgi:hypothetical protein
LVANDRELEFSDDNHGSHGARNGDGKDYYARRARRDQSDNYYH